MRMLTTALLLLVLYRREEENKKELVLKISLSDFLFTRYIPIKPKIVILIKFFLRNFYFVVADKNIFRCF